MVKVGFKFAALAMALAAATCGTAQATLLWYDGFDTSEYTSDTPLGGQSGGSDAGSGTPFFTGPYVAAGYPDLQYNTLALANGLTRPGLTVPTTPGGTGQSPANCQYGPGCIESRTSRVMTDPWSAFTDPDGTFYVSFLADFGFDEAVEAAESVHHRVFEMHVDGLDDSQRQLLLGFSSFVGDMGGTDLRLLVNDSAGGPAQAEPLEKGGLPVTTKRAAVQGTHMLVLKFEMSTTNPDVISAWLDPVGSIEGAPDAQVTVGQFLADRMSTMVQFSYGNHPSAYFDELRVGTEFGDVATNTLQFVPEPGTLALVGLGVIGMMLANRKRS